MASSWARDFAPDSYSVKVTLAGFMPSLQDHLLVKANLDTPVHIELGSVLTSVDRLRHRPFKPVEPDDWKWVLRTASSSRPVLQLRDGTIVIANPTPAEQDDQPRVEVELSNGSVRPGASSALPGNLGTAVSYDQSLGAAGKVLMAGEVDYDQTDPGVLGGSAATIWLPSGRFGEGPETTLVVHQIRIGDSGRSIRTMRFEHSEQMALTSRLVVEYGGEYLSGGLVGATTSSLRPHARLAMRLSPHWDAAFLVETDPDAYGFREQASTAQPAIDALQAGPVIVWGSGRPVLEGGWHEEFAVRHDVGSRGQLEAAAFRDDSAHQAIFGAMHSSNSDSSSPVGQLPGPFAHDAGERASGARGWFIARKSPIIWSLPEFTPGPAPCRRTPRLPPSRIWKACCRLATGIASLLGSQANCPSQRPNWLQAINLSMERSLAARISMARRPWRLIPISASRSGSPFPHSLCQDVGRPWPTSATCSGKAMSRLNTQDGHLLLMPVERSFRGGVSFQF